MVYKDGSFYCEKCGLKLKMNYKHDAYYCDNCDEWSEGQCSDKDCSFCYERPKKPSLAQNLLKRKYIKHININKF